MNSSLEPTLTQVACNALRDMFFSKQYNKIVPDGDIQFVLNSPRWHQVWGSDNLKEAWKQLRAEGYVSELKRPSRTKKWIWGIEHSSGAGETHG